MERQVLHRAPEIKKECCFSHQIIDDDSSTPYILCLILALIIIPENSNSFPQLQGGIVYASHRHSLIFT